MLSFGKIESFLRLIRWKNLLIMVLTMILMRYAIIEPLVGNIKINLLHGLGEEVSLKLQFQLIDFIVLVLSTVFIAAGGYVINDYFDIKTDLINRGNVIVSTSISRQRAMMWHNIFNVLGVAGGFYVSSKAGYFWFGLIFLLITGLLYFYSASYKRQFLVGNILVALLIALVPLLVVLFEWSALYTYCVAHAFSVPDFSFLFYWVGGFSIFAFLSNLSREIVKDIEDFEGDIAYGRNTMPVVLGIKGSKIVASTLVLSIILLIYFVWFVFINDRITLIYMTLSVVIPLLATIFLIFWGKEKSKLHLAGGMLKIAMLFGLLYSVVVKIILTWSLI